MNHFFIKKILIPVRNNIVKILPENSFTFKWISIFGLWLQAFEAHRQRKDLVLSVAIAEHCNLNCKCCSAFSPIAKESFMDVEQFKKDMHRLAEITDKLTFLAVTGGEPLLHPEVTEFFKIARECFPNIKIRINTNGTLLLSMPDTFWESCQKYKVYMSISRYPIKIDIIKIKEKAKKYQIDIYTAGGEDVPVKSMWKNPLDLSGKQTVRRSFKICGQANRCTFLKSGKIYTCNTIPAIEHFNNYFNKKLEVTENDYIDIYKVDSIDEILKHLCTPKPFCRYCNRIGLQLGIKWGPTQKDISEWT